VEKIARKVGASRHVSVYWEAVFWAKLGDKEKAIELLKVYIAGQITAQAQKEQNDEEQDTYAKSLRDIYLAFCKDYDIPEKYGLAIPKVTGDN
jgi:hypothetical protein